MHLSDYMASAGLSDKKLAEKVGCSRPVISRARRGLTRPEWPTIVKIEKLSKGKVTANDFAASSLSGGK